MFDIETLFLYNNSMKIIERKFLNTPTHSVHASTVALWKGNPVFAWFGGTREGAADVSIYVNNLEGDEKNIIIGDRDSIPRWNPILVPVNNSQPEHEKLYLFEKAGLFCDRWQTFLHDITNWTSDITPKEMRGRAKCLPAGINGPVKTAPITLKDQPTKLLCGSAVETFYDWTSYIEEFRVDHNKSTLDYIDRSAPLRPHHKVAYRDHRSGMTKQSMGIIQPALFEYGSVHAFFRSSYGLGKIYYSRTDNVFGKNSWLPAIPTNLQNPNSGIDVAVFPNQNRVFLVWNPSDRLREPLIVSELNFTDNVERNVTERIIDIKESIIIRDKVDDSDNTVSKELSYPYMIADEENNLLHLTYTYGRSSVEYLTIAV